MRKSSLNRISKISTIEIRIKSTLSIIESLLVPSKSFSLSQSINTKRIQEMDPLIERKTTAPETQFQAVSSMACLKWRSLSKLWTAETSLTVK